MNQNSVIVIGAGIAGLACAQTLIARGFQNVKIFEATAQYGGRLKPLQGFAKRHLEAGGQTIHHPQNDYFKLAQEAGAILENEVGLLGSIYDPITHSVMLREDFYKAYPIMARLIDDFVEGIELEDESVAKRMEKKGYPKEFAHIFKCLFGSEYGASIETLSARAVGFYERDMPLFVSDWEISNSIHHLDILKLICKDAIQSIQYQTPVNKIRITEGDQVELTLGDGSQTHCTKVVCCVPITQLKKIEFDPPLEEQRREQLNLVGMEKGGKFFLKLSKPFLPHEEEVFIIDIPYCSQWWDNSSEDETIVIGILAKDGSDRINEIGIEKFGEYLVGLINEQYKTDVKFLSAYFEDWGSTPYIEGLYSYPMTGAADNYRQIIGQPFHEKIFFAGEAFHKVFYQSIHGAYETGVDAAQQIQI